MKVGLLSLVVASVLGACGRPPAVEVGTPAAPPAAAVVALAESVDADDTAALVRRVLATRDHGGRTFAVIDKREAQLHVFAADGAAIGSAPVLLGHAIGDDSVPGIGTKAIADIRPEERTTPAGRFATAPGRNADGHSVVWLDYDEGLSMHVVIRGEKGERRLQRLASDDPAEHRISWGCVNLPAAFFRDVVKPAFAEAGGIVYVLPETRPLATAFPALFARE